jgi:hypothetical protein
MQNQAQKQHVNQVLRRKETHQFDQMNQKDANKSANIDNDSTVDPTDQFVSDDKITSNNESSCIEGSSGLTQKKGDLGKMPFPNNQLDVESKSIEMAHSDVAFAHISSPKHVNAEGTYVRKKNNSNILQCANAENSQEKPTQALLEPVVSTASSKSTMHTLVAIALAADHPGSIIPSKSIIMSDITDSVSNSIIMSEDDNLIGCDHKQSHSSVFSFTSANMALPHDAAINLMQLRRSRNQTPPSPPPSVKMAIALSMLNDTLSSTSGNKAAYVSCTTAGLILRKGGFHELDDSQWINDGDEDNEDNEYTEINSRIRIDRLNIAINIARNREENFTDELESSNSEAVKPSHVTGDAAAIATAGPLTDFTDPQEYTKRPTKRSRKGAAKFTLGPLSGGDVDTTTTEVSKGLESASSKNKNTKRKRPDMDKFVDDDEVTTSFGSNFSEDISRMDSNFNDAMPRLEKRARVENDDGPSTSTTTKKLSRKGKGKVVS